MSSVDELVERLRAYAKDQGGWHNIDETCEAAADALRSAHAAGYEEARKQAANYMRTTLPHLSLQEYATAILSMSPEDKP